jgi:hypothetical protein
MVYRRPGALRTIPLQPAHRPVLFRSTAITVHPVENIYF